MGAYHGALEPLPRRRRHLGIGADPGTPTDIEIVGVVNDSRYDSLRSEIVPEVYLCTLQQPTPTAQFIYVHTEANPDGVLREIRSAVQELTKLVCSWLIGRRDPGCGTELIQDLANRLANRVQLTTDGHKVYLDAIADAFADDIDYAMLVKIYGNEPEAEKRYSPAVCNGSKKTPISGEPDPKHISTSYIERQNLTMRMQMRRFTRLTNASSKKIENHIASIAIHYMHYNFCRIHQTLRVTPAMQAGISDHVWSITELVGLLSA